MGKKTRVNIILHEDNKYEKTTIDFLNRCGRKKGEILSVIISSFIEDLDFDLSDISKDELYHFFRYYPIARKIVPKPVIPVPEPPADAEAAKVSEKREEKNQGSKSSITDASEERGKAALAVFGI